MGVWAVTLLFSILLQDLAKNAESHSTKAFEPFQKCYKKVLQMR